ncbi:NYN domain-containing protein [Erysipelothrix sp. P66]
MTRKKCKNRRPVIQDNCITAILVDGGFFRKRLNSVSKDIAPQDAADELEVYCKRHLNERIMGEIYNHSLYRIFYYDCPPVRKSVYNPLTKSNDDLGKSETYSWITEFFECLKRKRKFSLRMGEISSVSMGYHLKGEPLKKLLHNSIQVSELTANDIYLNIEQKGVDMKIGLDIASLSYKKQVDQIVLISGDSDFVSAAKLARREGIDFILDPMGTTIKPNLFEHIDGLRTVDDKYKYKVK